VSRSGWSPGKLGTSTDAATLAPITFLLDVERRLSTVAIGRAGMKTPR